MQLAMFKDVQDAKDNSEMHDGVSQRSRNLKQKKNSEQYMRKERER